MKVALYTRPSWLDATVPLACALSRDDEVHLFIEIAPEHGNRGIFDIPSLDLREGVIPALRVLVSNGDIPASLNADLGKLAGLYLVVHNTQRVYHPTAVLTSLRTGWFIRSVGPDLIHLDDFTGRVLPLIYSLPSIPVIASLHDVEEHSGEISKRFHAIRQIGLKRVKALIFHSKHAYSLFKQSPRYRNIKLPETVIPLGTYTLVQHWESKIINGNDNTVLFFGRISPYKGLELLWKAAPLVAQRIPGVRFIVAGGLVSGYKLPPTPLLSGGGRFELRLRYIPNAETCALFRQCSIVVLPYINATQSGVVATAFAFNKPVVATYVGGVPEMVIDGVTGRLVKPRSVEALAEAIIELLGYPEERQRMSINIQKVTQGDLNWPHLAEMTRGVYKQVVA